jgi:hypothetical protein
LSKFLGFLQNSTGFLEAPQSSSELLELVGVLQGSSGCLGVPEVFSEYLSVPQIFFEVPLNAL